MFSKGIFGLRLLELRRENGETQGALGEVIGVTKTQISDLEHGKISTTLEKLFCLCEHYNVSADYLLGLTEEKRALNGKDSEV